MTTEPQASRTLVKSPPELWAELSDAESLGRHLNEFGEIRITRLEPETTVAWEGERARGTVRLEPSGWGTRVVLTARPVRAEVPGPPSGPDPTPPGPAPAPSPPTPGPAPAPPVPGPAPAPPVPQPAPLPPAAVRRRGILGRLRSFLAPQAAPAVGAPAAPAVRAPAAPSAAEATPSAPPLADAERTARGATEAILGAALDSLGQAHHRPFSRA